MTIKHPRLITFFERQVAFGDSLDIAPSIEITQMIVDLANTDDLPEPQFVATGGGDDAIHFAINSYSRAINQLLDIDSKVGISVVTGRAATVDNTESYNISFLLNNMNWWKHIATWKELGMSESTQERLENLLSNLIDLTCSVKQTTLNKEELQKAASLMQ